MKWVISEFSPGCPIDRGGSIDPSHYINQPIEVFVSGARVINHEVKTTVDG